MPLATYEIYITVPPDGGYSWVIALISFLGFIIADGIGNSFFLYRERMAQDLAISTSMSAAIGSTYSSLCLFFGPVTSAVCNHYGFRLVLIFGGILTSVGYGCAFFSDSYGLTIFFFGIVAGIGGACALISITAPVGYWFDKKRPIALGISSSGSGIGMLILPYTTELIMNKCYWKWAYLYHSALFSLYILLGIFLIPLTPVKMIPEGTVTRKGIHPHKLKESHRHRHAAELFHPDTLQPATADPWVQASMSRILISRRKESIVNDRTLGRTISASTLGDDKSRIIHKTCICCRRQQIGHRPLYRSDIFYQGSIHRLRKIEKLRHATKAVDYTLSVSKLPTFKDIEEDKKICVCYPEAIKRTLITMFDFTVMKEYSFLMFLLSNVFFTMGSCLPTLYIYSKAEAMNLPSHILQWLVPTIGIGTFFGRCTAGILLQTLPFIHAFHICFVVNLAVAILTYAIIFANLAICYFAYCACFGIFFGIFTSMRSLILVDFLGLERLTSATGVLFAFGGSALLIGPPLAEIVKILYPGGNSSVFYLAASLMMISIIFLAPMPLLKKT